MGWRWRLIFYALQICFGEAAVVAMLLHNQYEPGLPSPPPQTRKLRCPRTNVGEWLKHPCTKVAVSRDPSVRRPSYRSCHSSLHAFDGDDRSSGEDIISVSDRARVLLYRSCLVLASLGFAGIALEAFLGGEGGIGLSHGAIAALGEGASSLAGWTAGASALLAPRGADRGVVVSENSEQAPHGEGAEIAVLALDSALPVAGALALIIRVVGAIFGAESGVPSLIGDLSFELSSACVALVCAREMAYFGVGYKAEAAVAVVVLFLEPALGGSASTMHLPLSACLALSLLVLSVAKVFEPVLEDLRPGGSRFFTENGRETAGNGDNRKE